MKLPNPAKILRDNKALAAKKEESVSTLRDRLQRAFHKKNKEERKVFTEILKKKNIQALQLLQLTEEASKGKDALLRWERRVGQEGKANTLAEVQDRSTFSRVMVIVRELYADEDIAPYISFDEAGNMIIEEILLHP